MASVMRQGADGGVSAHARLRARLAPSLQTLPLWARVLSAIFTVAAGALSLSAGVVALVVADHVVENEAAESLYVIAPLGVVALLMALTLSVGRAYALAAAPERHRVFTNRVELVMAFAVAVVLWAVHPLLPLGVGVMALALLAAAFAESRLKGPEAEWLGPADIRHIASGREPAAVIAALRPPDDRLVLFEPFFRFAGALCALVALLVGGWLAAERVITLGGVIAGVIFSAWCVEPVAEFARSRIGGRRQRALMRAAAREEAAREKADAIAARDAERAAEAAEDLDAKAERMRREAEDVEEFEGLAIKSLRIASVAPKRDIAGPLDVEMACGTALGITGPPGSGKSMILKSIVCRHPFPETVVTGEPTLKGWPLWSGGDWFDAVSVVHLPQRPVLFPGGVLENILCFEEPDNMGLAERAARQALAKIDIFGPDADRLLAEDDVSRLSDSQQQMVAIARALLLNPDLLLMDAPDQLLPPAMHPALCDAIHVAQRGGAVVIVATNNRMILEKCDEVLMLQDGYVADRDEPEKLLERHGAGWSRINVKRGMEEEKRLHAWLRSHFRRGHDADNLRTARIAASEFLILSSADVEGEPGEEDIVSFDFKWQDGAFLLTMHDQGEPISAARIEATKSGRLGNKPEDVALRELMHMAREFEQPEGLAPAAGEDAGQGPGRSIRVLIDAAKGKRA